MYSAQNAAEISANADPGRVERVPGGAVAAAQAEYQHARDGEADPAGVAPALGQRGGQGERAEELDGHRGAKG